MVQGGNEYTIRKVHEVGPKTFVAPLKPQLYSWLKYVKTFTIIITFWVTIHNHFTGDGT